MSKWFVKGDIDGFFGLWMDNLINLLLIVSFLKGLLGFSDSLIFGRVLPAAALSLLGGNLFYAWQARRLAARDPEVLPAVSATGEALSDHEALAVTVRLS